MTMSHDQANDRLVDFLYETLPDEEQAAVALHLAGCPLCSAEVKAWKKVRSHAGAALRGPLDEAPPQRLHDAILAAARAAERAPRVVNVPAQTLPEAQARKGSWWEHWRKAWVVPAFAMAAVFCLFVISRNTLFHSRVGEDVARDQIATWEKATPPAAPTLADDKASDRKETEEQAASANAAKKELAVPASGVGRLGYGSGKGTAGAREAKDATSRNRAVAKRRGGSSEDVLDDLASPRERVATARGTSAGPAKAAPSRSERRDEASDKSRNEASVETRRAAPGGGAPAASAPTRFAQPPPPAARAPVVVAAPKPTAQKKSVVADSPLDWQDEPAPSKPLAARNDEGATSRPEPPRQERAAAPAAAAPEAAPAPARSSADEEESALAFDASHGTATKRPAANALGESVKRAERAFLARDWATAARLYRELVQRFPQDARVPAWKQKAQEAERASTGR